MAPTATSRAGHGRGRINFPTFHSPGMLGDCQCYSSRRSLGYAGTPHCWCHSRGGFVDFVLARILEIGDVRPPKLVLLKTWAGSTGSCSSWLRTPTWRTATAEHSNSISAWSTALSRSRRGRAWPTTSCHKWAWTVTCRRCCRSDSSSYWSTARKSRRQETKPLHANPRATMSREMVKNESARGWRSVTPAYPSSSRMT